MIMKTMQLVLVHINWCTLILIVVELNLNYFLGDFLCCVSPSNTTFNIGRLRSPTTT